jgi:hypothetical protein
VGDFNTPLSPIDRLFKQKINTEILEQNDTTDQMDPIDLYTVFHPTTAQCTFFSAVHGTFSKIDHILGHKASLRKGILSNQKALKLELNNQNNSRKYANNWKLNNTLFNDK